MPRSRRWVWYFAALAALAAAAVAIPLAYNLSRQLTPEQVAAARALWRAHGPRDFDLDYLEKRDSGGTTQERAYHVEVRAGRVASPDGGLNVEGMFDRMEAALREDAAAGRRPYATATFDKGDGHPLRYVRRDRAAGERLEWTVRLQRPGAAAN
jgi:hypothetical protein